LVAAPTKILFTKLPARIGKLDQNMPVQNMTVNVNALMYFYALIDSVI